jgi:kinesin family protein 18/19
VTLSLYVKVRRNVLDVTYHVSQYQNIIAELKGEIERLKDKMNTEPVRSSLYIFRGCY